MQQSNRTHQRGIGGAPTNYRRRRADHQNSAAAEIFTEATHFTEVVTSFASCVTTALPVNSVSVSLRLQRTKLCTSLGIWGAKSFFLRDLGGFCPLTPMWNRHWL